MTNKARTIALRDSFMAKQFNRALGVNDEPEATPEQVGELWEEIKQKDIKITKLTNKIYELHDIIKSQKQKNWEEFIHPERIDN
jgi:hypothetical protein